MADDTHPEVARRANGRRPVGGMCIAIVGGFDRQAPLLHEMAARSGHTVAFHTGNVHGRGAGELCAVVARSDLVVIVTDHNSHGGVRTAKRLVRQLNRTSIVLPRCGIARFGALLEALSAPERHARDPERLLERA